MPVVRSLSSSLLTLMVVFTAGGSWGSRETDEVAYIVHWFGPGGKRKGFW